jgi:O-antigen ligase
MRLRYALLAILIYSVCTVWVPGRWALSGLQAMCFIAVAVVIWRADSRGVRVTIPFVGMACWTCIQRAACWTEVRAATGDAGLYWLTAACLVWLGYQAHSRRFLLGFLVAGSTIALLGIVQLYSSGNRIFWLFPSGYDSMVIGPFVSPNNYAAFVELLIPLALVLGLESRRPAAYLMLAAALLAAVIASGSRAGAMLAMVECAAAFLLCRGRGRTRPGMVAMFLAAAGVFVAIIGYQFLWRRLSHSGDLYLVRREFLESSLAMIRTQPWRGFGLGTWPAVYPRFAVIDIGAAANHAHNEWVQWMAEGGIPALVLMVAAAIAVLRPAIRTGWGIGILAVLLHSLVDYPFLRLGSAAWTFALFGAVAATESHGKWKFPLPARMAVAIAMGLATVAVVRIGWADTLFRRGTPADVRCAIALSPERAEYYLALDDEESLRRAIALNPGMTAARLRLAWEVEARGDLDAAEQLTIDVTRYDHQFLPAWTAANLYFRRGRKDEFWHWARTAADMSYDDLGALFNLCFRVTDDTREVLDRVAAPRPAAMRSLLAYLVRAQRLDDAEMIAARVSEHATAADRDALLDYIEAAHAAGHATEALRVWDAMCRGGLVSQGGMRIGRGFDWHLLPVRGTQVTEDSRGLRVSFSGQQAEYCELATRPLALEKGGTYVMHCRYRTSDLPANSGLYWSLGPGREFPVDAAETGRTAEWTFTATAEAEQLSLRYRRAEGTTRIEGYLSLEEVAIHAKVPALSYRLQR